jgi:hypothetical protein
MVRLVVAELAVRQVSEVCEASRFASPKPRNRENQPIYPGPPSDVLTASFFPRTPNAKRRLSNGER